MHQERLQPAEASSAAAFPLQESLLGLGALSCWDAAQTSGLWVGQVQLDTSIYHGQAVHVPR